MPSNHITGIMHGTRAITADAALRLSAQFDNAEFWKNLLTAYDLAEAREMAAA